MERLFWLEDSAIGTLVSSTQWGYPVILSLHAIGMATTVGVSLMLIARVLGVAPGIPVTSMAFYWRVALGGFILNLMSGVALFCGSASELFFNWAFRIKLVLVFLGPGPDMAAGSAPACVEPTTSRPRIAGLPSPRWASGPRRSSSAA